MTYMFYVISKGDQDYDLFVEAENPDQAYDLWVTWIESMEDLEIDRDNYVIMQVPALTGKVHYLQWYSAIKPVTNEG